MLLNFVLCLAFLTFLDSGVTDETKRASGVYTKFSPGIYDEFTYTIDSSNIQQI